MKYQLQQPIHIAQAGRWSAPSAALATVDDRLFIVSDDANLGEQLIGALNERLASHCKVTPEDFDSLLDDALPAAGKRLKTCDLAMALLQPSGCLVAQMGKSRVLHFDREGDVQYDSRNEILDYGAKARTAMITRFKTGDCLLLTLADRVDPLAMATIAGDSTLDDNGRTEAFARRLAVNREQAPASYVLTMACGSSGGEFIKDVNMKWLLLYVALAAAIAALAWASLTGRLHMPNWATGGTELADTVPAMVGHPTATDSLTPPADAVAVPDERTADDQPPAEEAVTEKKDLRDDPPKDTREATPVEPPTNEPAAPNPDPAPATPAASELENG